MREIKFRVWLADEKKIYNNAGVVGKNVVLEHVGDGDVEDTTDFEPLYWGSVKDSTVHVMQYTGLKDKNGKDIYEGDILKCKVRKRKYASEFDWVGEDVSTYRNYVVEWWESTSNIGYRVRDGRGKTMMIKPSSLNTMEAEIIGNIYENIELINS